jgi:hypothetical protein
MVAPMTAPPAELLDPSGPASAAPRSGVVTARRAQRGALPPAVTDALERSLWIQGDVEPAPDSQPPPSQRRRPERLPCSFVMLDERNQIYTTENLAVGGLRYTGAARPSGEGHRLSLVAPNAGRALQIVARPVWMAARGGGWSVGARVEGDAGEVLRLQYLFHALAERRAPEDVLWTPFSLMDAADPAATVARIRAVEIASTAARVARLCGRVSTRPDYLWQWGQEALRLTTLSSVAPEWRSAVVMLKLCVAIFFTTLDDVADEQRDAALFQRIRTMMNGERRAGAGRADDPRIERLETVWRFIGRAVRALPRYEALRSCFEFDCATALHSQAYALMVGRSPEARGEHEERFWIPGTYCMPLFADLDLMCASRFDPAELGRVRDVVQEAQSMWAIANWLGTWEREVRVRDYSSGVFGEAVRRGAIDARDLERLDPDEIARRVRASDVEAYLLTRWSGHFRRADRMREGIQSVDVGAYLQGVSDLFGLQWASRSLL